MKKINLLLALCGLMFIFSACENEPYTMNVFFIENASESKVYLSHKYEYRDYSSPFVELQQCDKKKVYSYVHLEFIVIFVTAVTVTHVIDFKYEILQ